MSKSKENNAPRLIERYKNDIVPEMMKKFNYNNVMQVPRIEKIALNMGVGEGAQDAKFIDGAVEDMTTISGQKVVVTKSKKAISNFKIREGVPVGCRTTLRKHKMYEFLDRLLNVAIPRIRDFKGVSDSGFDGKGNYTLGIREQIIFPEINYDKVVKVRGLNITFVTSAETDEETYELLKLFGMPFQKR